MMEWHFRGDFMHSYLKGHPALVHATQKLEQLNPDQFEVYFEHRNSTQIDSKDQQVDSLTRSEDTGLAIRLIKDHKMGFSFTTSMDPAAIHEAVNTAFEIASFMPEDENLSLQSFDNFVYPNVDVYDTAGLNTPLSDKIEIAKSLEAYCRNSDSRIVAVRSASLTETSRRIHLVDSNGEHIEHQSTGYTSSITCKADFQGESQTGSEFAFSNYLDVLPIEATARLAAQWAVELLGAGSAPTMKCPGVLRNSVVADLLDFLASSFSAEEVDKSRSILANQTGQFIASNQVTLINDGLLPGGAGTTPFDAEGTPSQKTVLIEGGFLVNFLYDSYYSKKLKNGLTGSSVRNIKSPPSIGFSNLYIEPGRKSPESLTDGIQKGILITDLMGVHTANPVTGDFSLGATGILIENGRLTRPVRGFAVAGNILDVFRKITDIGSDLKFFGKVGAPSIRLSDISVGGA